MPPFQPAQSVVHDRLGSGVVLAAVEDGFVRVFFGDTGEQVVPARSLAAQQPWEEQISVGFNLVMARHFDGCNWPYWPSSFRCLRAQHLLPQQRSIYFPTSSSLHTGLPKPHCAVS